MGVPARRALPFGFYIRAPDFSETRISYTVYFGLKVLLCPSIWYMVVFKIRSPNYNKLDQIITAHRIKTPAERQFIEIAMQFLKGSRLNLPDVNHNCL